MPAGATAYFSVEMTAGRYAWIAEVPNPAEKSMLRMFTVAGAEAGSRQQQLRAGRRGSIVSFHTSKPYASGLACEPSCRKGFIHDVCVDPDCRAHRPAV